MFNKKDTPLAFHTPIKHYARETRMSETPMTDTAHTNRLPWAGDTVPLMLAPMQGLTNRALRNLFSERFCPDVVFTEFVRVRSGSDRCISDSDRQETTDITHDVPLVVQLIGSDKDAMVDAARTVQELGAKHLNINLGCPYGRMTNNAAGGALLGDADALAKILKDLRQAIAGSFSVKVRSGIDDPLQVLSLLETFEDCGIDFLIVHPRTVKQGFKGKADHGVTAQIVKRTNLPVIANGDVLTEADGRRVLQQTGAIGLMLGRGAITDPFLFARLKGMYPATSNQETRNSELQDYLQELLNRYNTLFCGEQQVLAKLREVLAQINDPELKKPLRKLHKCKKLARFTELLAGWTEYNRGKQ